MVAAIAPAPHIVATGIGKRYSGVSVLSDIDLEIAPGEVHSLVGENGAGKSTLLKILGGAIRADEGRLSFDGEQVAMHAPRDAIGLGVSLISQEGALVPTLSVLENVFLAQWSNRLGVRRATPDRRRFDELLEVTGFRIPPAERVDRLPMGMQQQVEILRALARGARVLALDEPTAVLGEQEKANLLGLIRQLADGGTTVLLVSHFLDEVLQVADRVTVLRDGRLVHVGAAADETPTSLVRHMVGRELDVLYPEPAPVAADAPIRLRATGLTSPAVHGVSLEVRAGEILGLAGLVGSGRTETLRLLFGADRPTAGSVEVDGRVLATASLRSAMAAGMAMVPESRKEQGLVLSGSVRHNIALASLGLRRRGPLIRAALERVAVAGASTETDVRAASLDVPVETLSGGNQQKALFAKWLLRLPKVLLVDEPTRGVDVAAKTQIHGLLVRLAASGVAIVCVSSELEELLALSHRIVVLRQGRQAGRFERGARREDVIAVAFGDEGDHDDRRDD